MKPFYKIIFVSFLLSIFSVGFSQNVHLIKDLNISTDLVPTSDYSTDSFAVMNSVTYFISKAPGGLWRSDGTPQGTYLIKAGIPRSPIVVAQDRIFIMTTSKELWVSDGTELGTHLVTAVVPSKFRYISNSPIALGNNILFEASIEREGVNYPPANALFISDGTEMGTKLVKDFYGSGQQITKIGTVENKLYFSIASSEGNFAYRDRLWVTDGSEAGTYKISDYAFDPAQAVGGADEKIYFSASDAVLSQKRLWVTTGLSGEASLAPGNNNIIIDPRVKMANVNGVLYFAGKANESLRNYSLYKYNPNELGGAQLVKEIIGSNPVLNSFEISGISYISNLNERLFFSVYNDVSGFYELWKTDGSVAGNVLLNDSLSSKLFTNAGGTIYFNGYTKKTGSELWKSDGTLGGTVLVKDIFPGKIGAALSSLAYSGGYLLFAANDGLRGKEVWRSDGTAEGTTLVKDANTTLTNSSSPQNFTLFGSRLLFVADNGNGSGKHVWIMDSLGKEITLLNGDIAPLSSLSVVGKRAYFMGSSDNIKSGLFITDGTTGGTQLVKDLSQNYISVNRYIAADSLVYMYAYNQSDGSWEIWRSDGSSNGTFAIITGLTQLSQFYATLGNVLFFSHYDGRCWSTHGTPESTQILKMFGAYVGGFINYRGSIYFSVQSGPDNGLWKSDGTPQGTLRISNDMYFGNYITVFKGELYFSTAQPSNDVGYELYKFDTLTNSVRIVKDIRTGGNSVPQYLFDANGTLYFFALDAQSKKVLWRSDGTADGTVAVANVGLTDMPLDIAVVDSTIYIYNDKFELWQTNGASSGTFQFKDNNLAGVTYDIGQEVDSYNFASNSMEVQGKRLFFAASSLNYGSELYVLGTHNGNLELCPPVASGELNAYMQGNIYQWQVSDSVGFKNIADTGFYTGTNTATLHFTNLPSAYNGRQFRCKVDNGYSTVYIIQFKNNWNGTVSTAWENPVNWDCGTLPDANTDVIIDKDGEVIISSNVSIKSLTLKPGVIFTVQPGYTLTINGKTIQ